jgi:hypothetical protein
MLRETEWTISTAVAIPSERTWDFRISVSLGKMEREEWLKWPSVLYPAVELA